MKTFKFYLLILIVLIGFGACTNNSGTTKAERNEWKLSMQSFTFHHFDVVQSLKKTHEAGVKYIEIYPGQRMGDQFETESFGYNLTQDEIEKLKGIAKEYNVKIISSGVWGAKGDEWNKVFKFAKDMNLEFLSAEPAKEDWDIVENLAKEYNIKLSTHNHPNESSYWKPEILLENISNRSNLLGSCADVGHYKRMGIEAVDALQELEGRIISFHFKDVKPNNENDSFEDVIWGQGTLGVKEILKELKRQKFKGYFTIEYEADWDNNLPQIKQSIEYFNSVVDDIF